MPKPDTTAQTGPKTLLLSVVLPVRNEERHLARVIGELQAQSLPRSQYEIIVVDGMSTDKTRDVVAKLQVDDPDIVLLDNLAGLSGAARNIGARHARSSHVLFVDGHCRILSERMLESVVQAFAGGARCVSRPQPLVPENGDAFQHAVSLARQSFLGHNSGSRIYSDGAQWCSPLSAGCGYERSLYLELGGIDERFDAGEDLEFNLRVDRMGIQARHEQDFAVAYMPRKSLINLFRQIYRYGYGRAMMAQKHPGSITPAAIGLALLSALAICLPLVGIIHSAALTFWAGLTVLHVGAVALDSALVTVRRQPSQFFRVMLCLLAIHHGAGLGYLAGMTGGPNWSHPPPECTKKTAVSS